MVPNINSVPRKDMRDLLEMLAPVGEVNGVSDYLLVDAQGTILARKPNSLWKEEAAVPCARDLAQVGETLRLLPFQDGEERIFDLHFKGMVFIGWELGSVYLFALCNHQASLPIMRMTVNVLKEELGKDRRFKKFLTRRDHGDSVLLSEQSIGSELYKHVTVLKQK
jgi:hypothetical protein